MIYVQDLRLEKSKALLESTDHSVEQVSWKIGYEDPSYFRALFKRLSGITPGDYRKKYRVPVPLGMGAAVKLAHQTETNRLPRTGPLSVRFSHRSCRPRSLPGVRAVAPLGPEHWIFTVPHHQGFTDTVPQLARRGAQFQERSRATTKSCSP